MSTDRASDHDRPAAAALAEAAVAAGRAPSVHNTQPWRWRVGPETLDLYADRSRQLEVVDRTGRLLLISCGAALHHARVALAAEGLVPAVARFPDPANPDHLARMTIAGRTAVTPAAMRLFQAIGLRRTDRREVIDAAIAPDAFDAIRQAAAAEGAGLHLLTAEQVSDLAAAATRANEIGLADPDQRAEMAYWIGSARPTGLGLPDAVIPATVPRTTVPGRDFGHPGTLAVGTGHDRFAAYAILFAHGDGAPDWLRAGEALSACWLVAAEQGVAVLPLSSVIEVPATREVLRRMLSRLAYPQLVLRLGLADPEHAGPPQTPRLPAEQTVETVPPAG